MRTQNRTVEEILRRFADAQHGVVTRAQLLAAGVSTGAIGRRVRNGTLLVVYPGVYRVGHRAPSLEAEYIAAVLACGDGTLLSGRAAGHLLGLLKRRPREPEVTTPTERRIEGIRTRRSRSTDRRDAMRFQRIPVTTVPRTLVDLAAVLTIEELARAFHEATVRYRTRPEQVEAVLARRPTSPGARKLRLIMRGEIHVTLSGLERRFLELLRDAGLPLPQTNRRAGSYRVDCRWPEQRLTVELDSYRFHHSRHAWEQDRRREREARALGDEFRRYTHGDVFHDSRLMLRELSELLQP
jgi:very-short-patch-repair endonuclease